MQDFKLFSGNAHREFAQNVAKNLDIELSLAEITRFSDGEINIRLCESVRGKEGVVTRYFGGVLLGAGGLVRAYTQSAKDALDAAGISVVRRWVEVTVPCPYSFFERVRLEVEAQGGVLGETEYAADVTVHALLPEGAVEAFSARVTELTAGGSACTVSGEAFKAVPRK